MRLQRLEGPQPDPGHAGQVRQAPKRAAGNPFFHDGPCAGRPHAGKATQEDQVGPVGVDLLVGCERNRGSFLVRRPGGNLGSDRGEVGDATAGDPSGLGPREIVGPRCQADRAAAPSRSSPVASSRDRSSVRLKYGMRPPPDRDMPRGLNER